MTEFDLLEGSDGRLFLKVYTGKAHCMVELDREKGELHALRTRLDEPPSTIRGR